MHHAGLPALLGTVPHTSAAAGADSSRWKAIVNPYYELSYERRYDKAERQLLMEHLNVRTGHSVSSLMNESLEKLHSLMDSTRSEFEVSAEEARGFLAADERPRVHAFVSGSAWKRSLLVGTAAAATFLDEFMIFHGHGSELLVAKGRTLRHVVGVIRDMGGLEAAAERLPWLRRALPLARDMDWRRLASQLIFVRSACAWEREAGCMLGGMSSGASDSKRGRSAAGDGDDAGGGAASDTDGGAGAGGACGVTADFSIEEGQHRAIAAAWLLTRNGTMDMPIGPSIAYLRGAPLPYYLLLTNY